MGAAGLLSMMLHLVVNGDFTPATLNLKETKLICQDIGYTFTKDGYNYVGIYANKRNYLTNYVNSDILQKEIDSQCKK